MRIQPQNIPNMLELLLSILALFGLSPDKSGKPISINAEIYSKISSMPITMISEVMLLYSPLPYSETRMRKRTLLLRMM